MKSGSRKKRLTFFLVGLMVLAGPLCFFNSLFTSAIERARESAYGLLREEILQAAEDVRNRMRPIHYVTDIVKEVHREVLPEVTPDIIKMLPDTDFGNKQFSRELPAKFLAALRRHGLDAIQIVVNPPEFSDVYYWNSDELKKQCPIEDELAQNITANHYYSASQLYLQQYQKQWLQFKNVSPFLQKAIASGKYEHAYAYLTRFSQVVTGHDRASEYFTDYFGQQSIYRYSYCCISKVNLHGAYTVFVPQTSVSPQKILDRALQNKEENISIEMVEASERHEGFIEKADGLEYMTLPPSEFWNHLFFWTSTHKASATGGDKKHLKITGKLPEPILRMQNYYRLFVPMAVLSLLFYIAMAFRFSYAGLELGMPLKLKLAGILGLIICLPISGTGILTFLGLSGSGRVLENHLLERTLNSIREFSLINHENLLGQVLAALEVKRRLEKTDKKNRNLKTVLAADDGTLNWYITYSNSINLTQDTGEQFQYNPSLDQANPNRLINSLLSKYTDSLGLSKVTRHQHGGHLTRTMTLGIMENYITPKMEEAWMVHESTVQREISHSSDTSRAIFYLVRDSNDDYILIYHRVCNNDEHVHRYLSWFNANQPFWFKKNGKYGDVMLGVRLRRYGSLFSFAWPTESLLSEDMNRIFEKAVAAKNFGHQIERKSGNIEARAWRWQEGESAVTAAFCQSKGAGIAGFAGSMLAPLLIGYAILLLFFITSIISEFISQPVKIIEAGVEQLKNERYGTLIASFSDDEFKHMTNAFNEMSNALRQREMIKRYVSGRLLQEVQTSSANHDAAAGQLEKVSILASDIRNFTSTSEKYSPAEIVDMLNSYFTLMEEAVKENGGVIDKYIGDAIQAIFYNDDSRENSAIRACRAAVDMRQRLNIFNQNRREAGLFTVENGIGIDTGMVISGSIGSEGGRKDFTVIGKATDIAARLESLTVNCNSRILISKATLNAAGPGLRTLDFDGEAEELLYD